MIETVNNPHLGTFMGFPNDHLFSLIKGGSDFIDDYVKKEIDKYVKPDSVCVDVGANLGYVSVYLSKRCKKVYSIEPQPTVFLQLCGNLFLNECFNVTPLNFAATSYRCHLDFAPYQSGWVGAKDLSDYNKITSIGSVSLKDSPTGKIEGRLLDEMIGGPVDFIKIDAQGADIDVIMGAQELIKKYRPIVVFENENDLAANNYGRQMNDLEPVLRRLNYDIDEIYDNNFLLKPL